MGKRIVIALGGNALGKHAAMSSSPLVTETAKPIVDLIEEGNEVVIAHGNGPQVGMINLGMATACHRQAAIRVDDHAASPMCVRHEPGLHRLSPAERHRRTSLTARGAAEGRRDRRSRRSLVDPRTIPPSGSRRSPSARSMIKDHGRDASPPKRATPWSRTRAAATARSSPSPKPDGRHRKEHRPRPDERRLRRDHGRRRRHPRCAPGRQCIYGHARRHR